MTMRPKTTRGASSVISSRVSSCSALIPRTLAYCSAWWDVVVVFGKVVGVYVMAAVGRLPRKVRRHHQRMYNPTEAVVEQLGWREGAVAALVAKNL